jgi:uncharacterized membrane protein YeaQ/YmgE (transglycosylase-associated protein family)
VTDLDRLHRSYARLLWAYPRWYRRERGLELMTTLLDDAGPGRHRPHWSTVADLIGGGVKTRMRPPRGFVARFITVVVSLSGGLVGSSAAVMLSPYPGPPAAAEAVAAAEVAVGLPVHDVPGPIVKCYDGSCETRPNGDDVVAYDEEPMRVDNTVVTLHPLHLEVATIVEQAYARLVAAGWRVDPSSRQGANFSAFNDRLGLNLAISVGTGDTVRTDVVRVYVSKRVSAATIAAVIAGFLGSLLAGWLIGAWTMQRFKRHQRSRRRDIRDAAVPFLIGAVVMICFTFGGIAIDWADGVSPEDVQAPLVFILFWWPVTVVLAISGLYGLVALWLAARPEVGRDVPPGERSPASHGAAS